MAPRHGLNKAVVVQAAVSLLEEERRGELSLSRLAEKLAVRVPSLYNHVDGLAGLRRELALENANRLGEAIAAAVAGRSGSETVVAVCQAYRAYILENPGLYFAALHIAGKEAPVDLELQQADERIEQTILAALASISLEGDEAVHAVRALRSAAHGFATLEIAGVFGLPGDHDESFRRLSNLLAGQLRPPDSGQVSSAGLSEDG